MATDSAGNVYVADASNYTIRKITPVGVVTTFAGLAGSLGSADGTGSAARFYYPTGVSTDSVGNVYVADRFNHTIRKITSAGMVTTFAGLAGSLGSADGTGSAARFYYPTGVSTDSVGNVYVADRSNSTIRKITSAGVVTTLAGLAGSLGSADGTGSAARFYYPTGVATDSAGNVYVADQGNSTIRKITSAGVVTTLAGLAGSSGSADGTGSAARFYYPTGVATDNASNVYVADRFNHTIRKITPAGVVTTLAGLPGSLGSVDGTGSTARFNYPTSVATDNASNVYVADQQNNTIRKGSPAITDIAVIDAATGCTGALRQLDTTPQTATSWQWRISRQPSGSTVLSSTTIRNPTITPDAGDLYEFLLTATNSSGSSITTVTLNASARPAIGTQPAAQSACVGGSATFSVTAFGAPGYQWYNPSGSITGATGSTFTINPVKTSDAGIYYVSLTNTCGITLSNNASLTVLTAPPSSPGNSLLGGKSGGMINLSWTAPAGATSYTVKRCAFTTLPCTPGVTIAASGSTSYSEATDASSYMYTVEAVNGCGATP